MTTMNEAATLDQHMEADDASTTMATEPCARCGCRVLISFDDVPPHRNKPVVLCVTCKEIVCADCGTDTADALVRCMPGFDRRLCTACCALYPGRAWMRPAAAQDGVINLGIGGS